MSSDQEPVVVGLGLSMLIAKNAGMTRERFMALVNLAWDISREDGSSPESPRADGTYGYPQGNPSDDEVLDFLVAYYGFPDRATMESFTDWQTDIRDEVKLIQSWATLSGSNGNQQVTSLSWQPISEAIDGLQSYETQEIEAMPGLKGHEDWLRLDDVRAVLAALSPSSSPSALREASKR